MTEEEKAILQNETSNDIPINKCFKRWFQESKPGLSITDACPLPLGCTGPDKLFNCSGSLPSFFFPVAVIKYPDKINSRETGFISSHRSRIQSAVAGKSSNRNLTFHN